MTRKGAGPGARKAASPPKPAREDARDVFRNFVRTLERLDPTAAKVPPPKPEDPR